MRVINKIKLAREITEVFMTKTTDEWGKLFENQFAFGR
jgi:hypothetical protein